MKLRFLLLCVLVLVSACGSAGRARIGVPFRVRTPVRGQDGALDDRPLAGADHLVTWVEDIDGEKVDDSERNIALPAARLSLPTVKFGTGFVLRVDGYGGDVLLSRGRSFPFDVSKEGTTQVPDLFISSLGRFARRTSASLNGDPRAIFPTPDGALVALTSGSVVRFLPLSSEPFAATSITLDATTRFVVIGDRFLGAFSSQTKSLSLIGPDGVVASTVESATLSRHGSDAMLVSDPSGSTVLIVGGEDDVASEDATAITRVQIPADPSMATSTALASLPASRWAGHIVWIDGATSSASRALVLGGTSHVPSSSAYLVDPRDAGAVATLAGIDVSLASVIALGAGQALVVGGSAFADVRLLIIDDEPPSLTVASPPTPSLSVRRDVPVLVRFAPGLVLVVGGRSSGSLVRSAEIVDLRDFPGSTVQTGSLPASVVAPLAASLGDRSVWALDRNGTFGYVPPRGQ